MKIQWSVDIDAEILEGLHLVKDSRGFAVVQICSISSTQKCSAAKK
jgi:hypothetical protein